MAKFNISFNGNGYSIEESALASAYAELQSHLSTIMNGTGATISLGETTYNIDAAKLTTATNAFISHLGTVAGSGSKVVVNGTEYAIDSTKMGGAIADLETVLGGMNSDDGEGNGSDEDSGVDATTGEIVDSWEQIIAAVNNGTYATRYSVGNYKPLDLGSEGVVNMQIAAIDGDVMSDGSGNAHITWIAKELLATVHNMNNSYTNANGWAASEMRTYLQSDIWALIPTDVQNAIVAVDKTYYDYTTKSTLTCSDKVWIPSFREVNYGSKAEDSGVIYSELFTNTNARIKNLNGSAAYWWLRSAESVDNVGSSEHFWIVFSMGLINSGAAALKYGVALSFCF